jgi:uncharacterized RDD family membrane protein YckC
MSSSDPLYGLALMQDDLLAQGVLSRRFAAWWVDLLLIGIATAVFFTAGLTFGLLTFGLGWHVLGFVPVVPFCYHWLTLASPMSATPGQAMMGLIVRRNEDLGRPTMAEALASVLLFYLTLAIFCPLLLLALFTVRKRTPHDMLSGLVVIRRRALDTPILTQAPGSWNMPGGHTHA